MPNHQALPPSRTPANDERMDNQTESRLLGLASLALGLFGVFAPYRWHRMPPIVTDGALILALVLFLLTIWTAIPARLKRRTPPVLAVMLIVCGGVFAAAGARLLYLGHSNPATRAEGKQSKSADKALAPPITPATKTTADSVQVPSRQRAKVAKGEKVLPRHQPTPVPSPRPLKRLIAYDAPRVDVTSTGESGNLAFIMPVVTLTIQNVGDDTISLVVSHFRIYIDGSPVLNVLPAKPYILSQTQSMTFQGRPNDHPIVLSTDMKMLTIDIEITYDTIPESGPRVSARTIQYPINFANGPKSSPLLNSPQIVDQSER